MSNAGRPTKYKEEFDDIAEEYLDGGYENHGHVIPSKVGLASILKVDSDTISNWAEKHPSFFGTLKRLHDRQHLEALNGGLSSAFNAAITKLVLHNHGYSDKQQIEQSNKEVKEFGDMYGSTESES